jgi:hypothetical protein
MPFTRVIAISSAILLALTVFLAQYSIFITESGYLYHYQNFLTKKVEVYEGPGIYFNIPFLFEVTRYAQDWTVTFGIAYGGEQLRRKGPINVTFADTYTAEIPATFRYKLPRNDFTFIRTQF